MALLDDLKGLLSPEDFAKIEANAAVKTKIAKGDELYSYYVGEEPPVQQQTQQQQTQQTQQTHQTQQTSQQQGGTFDLHSIESMLDRRLGDLGKKLENVVTKDEFAQTIAREGARLAAQATNRADELNRIYMRHSTETGKPFDSAEFNAFLEKPENKVGDASKPIGQGAQSRFQTITAAYEEFIRPVAQQREVERQVQERLKAHTGNQPGFPGSTPGPSANKIVDILKRRNVAADGGGNTRVDRAAAALANMESSRQVAAS